MATLTRAEIIALAKTYVGQKAENLVLTNEYDFIIQDISRKAPVLPGEDTGTLTADQNYIDLPSNYVSQRLFIPHQTNVGQFGYLSAFKVNSDWLELLKSPVDFQYYDDTQYGTPSLYMVEDSPNIWKIYFYPKTETDTPTYKFLYFKVHGKSDGDSFTHDYGEAWDDMIAHGVAWKAAFDIIQNDRIANKQLGIYLAGIREMRHVILRPRYARVAYHHF